jgi:Protein of unknown function (DUF3047)
MQQNVTPIAMPSVARPLIDLCVQPPRWLLVVVLLATGALAGCANTQQNVVSPSSESESTERAATPVNEGDFLGHAIGDLLHTPDGGEPWQPLLLPGKKFADFRFERGRQDRPALSVRADRSVSILRRRYADGIADIGNIDFSWKIDGLPEGANLGEVDRGDAPVRILLSFDGDRSKWSARNHRLSEMSRLLTGEELPYATLMYVWSNHDALGSVVVNPRTDRIRKVVVESGPAQIGRWRDYRRDIRADFVQAFGEEPGPLRAVALMTDTDNTRSRLQAWYGPLKLVRR